MTATARRGGGRDRLDERDSIRQLASALTGGHGDGDTARTTTGRAERAPADEAVLARAREILTPPATKARARVAGTTSSSDRARQRTPLRLEDLKTTRQAEQAARQFAKALPNDRLRAAFQSSFDEARVDLWAVPESNDDQEDDDGR